MTSTTAKRALITGASGDIGAAIASTLHHDGMHVTLSGTRISKLQDLHSKLENSSVLAADLSKDISPLLNALSDVDVLVNNAGINYNMLAINVDDEQWNQIIQVNLKVTFQLSKAVLRFMLKKRWGRIINIASIVAFTGNAGQTPYTASKAGIVAMSKSMAQEVAKRHVTVNCVAPGFISTPMTADIPEDLKTKMLAQIPMARYGSPQDVADAVSFLASTQASYITGQTIHVNGGMFMS